MQSSQRGSAPCESRLALVLCFVCVFFLLHRLHTTVCVCVLMRSMKHLPCRYEESLSGEINQRKAGSDGTGPGQARGVMRGCCIK